MIGVETVWVRAFNKWMPTGYVEGDREVMRDSYDVFIDEHEHRRREIELRLNKLEFYPKLRVKAWDENDQEWTTVPKRRPRAQQSKLWKRLTLEAAGLTLAIADYQAKKRAILVELSGAKAQRRAEFLRALMLTPEWIKAQCDDHKRREFKYEIDSLCNDDERAHKTQYSLKHQRGHILGEPGSMLLTRGEHDKYMAHPPPSPERDLYAAMRAQAVEPPTWMERFRRWLLS